MLASLGDLAGRLADPEHRTPRSPPKQQGSGRDRALSAGRVGLSQRGLSAGLATLPQISMLSGNESMHQQPPPSPLKAQLTVVDANGLSFEANGLSAMVWAAYAAKRSGKQNTSGHSRTRHLGLLGLCEPLSNPKERHFGTDHFDLVFEVTHLQFKAAPRLPHKGSRYGRLGVGQRAWGASLAGALRDRGRSSRRRRLQLCRRHRCRPGRRSSSRSGTETGAGSAAGGHPGCPSGPLYTPCLAPHYAARWHSHACRWTGHMEGGAGRGAGRSGDCAAGRLSTH